MRNLDSARLIDLPTVEHPTGNITVAEVGDALPFDLSRAYFLHGMSESSQRGHHAHIELEQIIVAASGSFEVTVEDQSGQRRPFKLSDPTVGLYIPSMLWRGLSCFTKGAICLVFCSHAYDESDYIRNYETFRSWRIDEE